MRRTYLYIFWSKGYQVYFHSEEIKANSEPYEEELKLIANLIQYCLRFELPSAGGGGTPAAPSVASTNNGFLAVPGQSGHPRRGSHESGLREAQKGA